MNFEKLCDFVEKRFPDFGAVCKLNLANAKECSIDDVTLNDAISELSICNPRLFGLVADFAALSMSIKPDSKLF